MEGLILISQLKFLLEVKFMFLKQRKEKRSSKKRQWQRYLAEHSFFLTIILFLASVAIGCLVYYKYIYLAESAEPIATTSNIKIKEDAFYRILGAWQKREGDLSNISNKQYKNPFFVGQKSN